MPLPEETDKISVPVVILKSQEHKLREKGINRSSFMRQAIDAYFTDQWNYDYTK